MPDAKWLEVARGEIGVHETAGPGATSRIVEYAASTSLKAKSDEVPWCSSFVNWCFEQVGIEGTDSAAAISWVTWGQISMPFAGAVVVLRHKESGLDQATGSRSGNHVGFWLGQDKAHVRVLGGNQGDSVKESLFPLENYQIIGLR